MPGTIFLASPLLRPPTWIKFKEFGRVARDEFDPGEAEPYSAVK
jgi:hypothetical protein